MALGERYFPRVDEEVTVSLQVAAVSSEKVVEHLEEHADEVAAVVEEAAPEWPLKLSPELYLVRYPNGQHASLARRVTRRSE